MHKTPTSSSSHNKRKKQHWRKPRHVLVHSLDHENVDWQPGDPLVPSLRLRGMWLHEFLMAVGTYVEVEYTPRGILLCTPNPTDPAS
jgi:toxic protein SymE